MAPDNPIGREDRDVLPGARRRRGREPRGIPRRKQQRALEQKLSAEVARRIANASAGAALATAGDEAVREFGSQVAAAQYLGKRWAPEVLDVIGAGATLGQKVCLVLFARIMGWSAEGMKHQTLILQRIGAISEEQAREAVALLHEHESVDMDYAAEKAVELLAAYLRRNPQRRDEVRRNLGFAST